MLPLGHFLGFKELNYFIGMQLLLFPSDSYFLPFVLILRGLFRV